jgi:hypothetical protein
MKSTKTHGISARYRLWPDTSWYQIGIKKLLYTMYEVRAPAGIHGSVRSKASRYGTWCEVTGMHAIKAGAERRSSTWSAAARRRPHRSATWLLLLMPILLLLLLASSPGNRGLVSASGDSQELYNTREVHPTRSVPLMITSHLWHKKNTMLLHALEHTDR